MGPTWPNRFYMSGATAGGCKANEPFRGQADKTIWGMFRKKCLSTRTTSRTSRGSTAPTRAGSQAAMVNTARIFDNQPAGAGVLETSSRT